MTISSHHKGNSNCLHLKLFLLSSICNLIYAFLCVQNDSNTPEKKRMKLQSTKKRGCKGVLSYERVIRFPSRAIAVRAADTTATQLKKLKESAVTSLLAERSQIEASERFYLSVPTQDSHDGHLSSALGKAAASLSQRVHPKFIDRIHDFVEAGVRDAKEIKKLLALEVSHSSHQVHSDWLLHVPRSKLCSEFRYGIQLLVFLSLFFFFFFFKVGKEKYER